MDIVDSFLVNHTTPEHYELLMSGYNQLISSGYVEHEINIENYVALDGTMDNSTIVMLVENELINACHNLALKYYVVCRKDNKLKPYVTLLSFLDYMENNIESETIIYHENNDLDAREQLLSWVEIFRNDISLDISDLVLDVMDSLIDNILEIHELKVDIEPIEPDEMYYSKIKCLKVLRDNTAKELLAILLVKKNHLTSIMSIDEIANRFRKIIYADDTNPEKTAYNIISLAVMSPNDIGSLGHDARSLVNLIYDDVKKTQVLVSQIDTIMDQSGELCKTMNTI